MKTLNIAICEDVPADALLLRRLIRESGILADIFTYENGEAFLAAFKPGFFQLIILDIYLDGSLERTRADRLTGMDVAFKIRETDEDVWLAFATISPDHAVFGYQVSAERYLKKPLDITEVTTLAQRAAKYWEGVSDEIVITADRKRRHISPRDIMYIEVFGKKSIIHLQRETITAYVTIDGMERLMSKPSFLRSHRSYIVNMDYIKTAGRDFIMANGDKVYISRTNQWKIRRAYRDYLVRLAREGQ